MKKSLSSLRCRMRGQNWKQCQNKKHPLKTTVSLYFLWYYGITFHLITVKITETFDTVFNFNPHLNAFSYQGKFLGGFLTRFRSVQLIPVCFPISPYNIGFSRDQERYLKSSRISSPSMHADWGGLYRLRLHCKISTTSLSMLGVYDNTELQTFRRFKNNILKKILCLSELMIKKNGEQTAHQDRHCWAFLWARIQFITWSMSTH